MKEGKPFVATRRALSRHCLGEQHSQACNRRARARGHAQFYDIPIKGAGVGSLVAVVRVELRAVAVDELVLLPEDRPANVPDVRGGGEGGSLWDRRPGREEGRRREVVMGVGVMRELGVMSDGRGIRVLRNPA